jgi:multisubunit Na+/H+ antiporter MnhG subunit
MCFALVVYWVVILAALIVAFNGLGLHQVTDLLTRVYCCSCPSYCSGCW